jgi:hypothetical protein
MRQIRLSLGGFDMRFIDPIRGEKTPGIVLRAVRRTRAALALAVCFVAAAVVLANVLAWLSGEPGSVAATVVAVAIALAAGIQIYRLPLD